jgi:hypothetical protein
VHVAQYGAFVRSEVRSGGAAILICTEIDNDSGAQCFCQVPPTVGSSDNTFLIVDNGGFSQAGSLNENVYFQLSEDAVAPEPSTLSLLGVGLLAAGIRLRKR